MTTTRERGMQCRYPVAAIPVVCPKSGHRKPFSWRKQGIPGGFLYFVYPKPFSPLSELRFDSRLSLHKGLRVRLHPGHGTLLRTAGRAARSHGGRDQRTRPRQ